MTGTKISLGLAVLSVVLALLGCPSHVIVLEKPDCEPGATRVGNTCVAAMSCTGLTGSPCQKPDGGTGVCQIGGCLDTVSDRANCGSYGYACPPDEVCVRGECELGDGGSAGCTLPYVLNRSGHCTLPGCGPGNDNQACISASSTAPGFCCQGECVVTSTRNCGGCGITCSGATVCDSDTISPMGLPAIPGCVPAITCSAASMSWEICRQPNGEPGTCCGTTCTDTQSDPENCYSCGTACATGSDCQQGRCSRECTVGGCPPGTACQAVDNVCEVLACGPADEGNWCYGPDAGTGVCCGGQCRQWGQTCRVDGVCYICQPGEVCVGNTCSKPADCSAGFERSPEVPCLDDAGEPGSCCGATCVTVLDPSNCGSCGGACGEGMSCVQGVEGAQCQGACDPVCACPAGTVPTQLGETGGRCLPATCDGTNSECATDGGAGTCCGDTCEVSSPDGGDCGGCGRTCPAGSFCNGPSVCQFPDGGLACGAPRDDPFDVGAACPAGSICESGSCEPILDCEPGSQQIQNSRCLFGLTVEGACCGNRCVAQFADPNNCGGCGLACSSGVCIGYSEGSSFYFGCLPPQPTSDCAVSCGPGTICADGFCVGGNCGYDADELCFSAEGTVGFCCGVGDCAPLTDDPQNCGLCGNACLEGQRCVSGVCTGNACDAATMFGFCNLDAGIGFTCCPGSGCVDILTDSRNCGWCGDVCPSALQCRRGACGGPDDVH